jgi:hypothetical protein
LSAGLWPHRSFGGAAPRLERTWWGVWMNMTKIKKFRLDKDFITVS